MIKKIKWNNHISLGNLELDFKKSDGAVYNTIILAGENGSGKTTILNTLSTFLNGHSMEPFEYIDYDVDNVDYHIVPQKGSAQHGFHIRFFNGNSQGETVRTSIGINEDIFEKDSKDIRFYGCSYSKARSGFNTQPVKSVTTQQVDVEKYEPDNQDNFTRIKQLLIDIEQQDDAAWRKETEQGNISDSVYNSFYTKRSKSFRFKNAFNSFFVNITFDRIDNNNSQEKTILFKKHGKSIAVDDLSTGEKQIVFRGAHLLKNINSISGGIVLIDEPELSMHPMWQKKILNYYRNLFTINGLQTVQMIMATHSEYVLQSALYDSENVLIINLSDNQGVIEGKRIAPGVLPTITAAETNYIVFGILSIDYHIELYGYLQSKEGKHHIKDCDSFIAASALYDSTKHSKPDSYNNIKYQTLPTYIRNAIDHPDSGRTYTEKELKTSIELLIELCR